VLAAHLDHADALGADSHGRRHGRLREALGRQADLEGLADCEEAGEEGEAEHGRENRSWRELAGM
jgi:hypothetical protein